MDLGQLHIVALLLGFALDKALGDPERLPHPIVAFGRAISWFEKRWNRGAHRVLKGTIASVILIALVFVIFASMLHLSSHVHPYLALAVESIFVFYGLAGTTLIKEGKGVFAALEQGLEQGQQQVGRIVGRDTSALSAYEIKAATLETLAENLSDGVIAPLFWFLIAGVPGMMTYKMVNTLDSMIAYKSDRYVYFGRFAARFDDLANYLPARITALLMALCGMRKRAFVFIKKYGRAHSSPNAGYPEAALAGLLHVQFGGTHNYFGKAVEKPVIGEHKRDYTYDDLRLTIRNMRRVEFLFLVIVSALVYVTPMPWCLG